CLHVAAWIEEENDPYQIISYCMSEWPSKWKFQKNNQDQNFTFVELYKLNITSEQLYLWSAPMDVVEHYQFYLNLLLTSNTSSSSMVTYMFYNCTSPRFGPLCQYSLDAYKYHHLTLNEIIREYYLHKYEPTTLTCYTHLQCDRGSIFACLDWSEICDGVIDCRNGIDEESCWQFEINECEDNESYHPSTTIVREIQPSDRCPYINEVLDHAAVKFHLLRRIKYYHLPCERHLPPVSCFYDDNYFCLCDDYGQHRVANCFEFNYTKKFDCFGQSNCENGAQCLQDRSTCPQTSTCVCQTCFYGRRCQFSSHGFGLSLDAILGYHIQPHIIIRHQTLVVQLSIVLTIIMTVAGLINSTLLMIAINNKEPRKIGCGIYLISTSITSLFTMLMFALKFSILIIAQMTYITNRLFLRLQCTSIDFVLRIGFNMDQWLSACVAVERTVTTIKGISFDRKKSKQMAKYIILILLILNISTTIHDPIHRRLIDDDNDDDEKRIWCIVTYSSNLQTFNTVLNIFHFLTPFIINLISGLVIIIMTTRRRTAVRANESFRKMLQKQFQEHSHLLITPILLVILAIPRLIISLISRCMKSINDPWLFLIGYFISFMPSVLTFVVFVLPSKVYKQEFWKAYARYKKVVQIRLHLVS
ncbi:unnamed protein product, partial [Rotaria sp. Silwood1]